jgi:hypothetical protein
MDYVIKIGNSYIGCVNGKYTEVNNIHLAMKGPMHKLTNLVKNCVAPDKRKKCNIVAESTELQNSYKTATKVTNIVTNSTFDEVIAKFKTIDVSGFTKEHSELSQRLSQIDQEITDIQHYIEFHKLNAAEGYKVYKLLQDKLLVRRGIKDDMAKFQILNNAKVSDIFDGTLEKNLEVLANRTYTPRVLKELFTEGKD